MPPTSMPPPRLRPRPSRRGAPSPGAKRRAILHAIADAIEARAEEIALVESMDTGQPIRYMAKAALRGAENYRFFADRAPGAGDGLSLPDTDHINYTIRQPIGPVGIITPWNTPFMLSTWKIAPALAAGCTVVHKPAEWSPLSATLLNQIMDGVIRKHGLPAGVVNMVHGLGEEAGKALTEHPLIKAVGFVGDSKTGSLIMAQGAPTLKRVHFELGGKNPVIVFDDADLDRALDAVLFMIYSLNGERCTSSSRALVQRSIYDGFTARLAERVKKIKVGHPLDPATEIGPLIHPAHVDKVLSFPGLRQEGGREDRLRRRPGHGRQGQLRRADALSRRQARHAHRPGRDLRAGAHRCAVRRRGRCGARSPTTCATASPATSGPATSAAPTASPATWKPA